MVLHEWSYDSYDTTLSARYIRQRQDLINALQIYPTIYETIKLNTEDLLKGNANLSFKDNCTIFDQVCIYIEATSRFKKDDST